MSDINQQFETAVVQRYYDEGHRPSFVTLGDVVKGMNRWDVPKKYLAADSRLLPETRTAILNFFKDKVSEFDTWLAQSLNTPRHNLKILLDSNFPESVFPYIEDRLGSFDVAPKGVSKRTESWDKQEEYDLVLIRDRGSVARASPQFAAAAGSDNAVSGAPIAVLCTANPDEGAIKQLIRTLDKIIVEGHLTPKVQEVRISPAGMITFHKGKKDADVQLFRENVSILPETISPENRHTAGLNF